MKFNKAYQEFMESKGETFYVEMDCLYSSKDKLEKTVESINNKQFSHSKGKPVLVTKIEEEKYYIVDGVHRALESACAGAKRLKVETFEYSQDISETDNAEMADKIKSAVRVTKFVEGIYKDIDESRVPRKVPRYLYHATYKQMLPTIKKNGGLKVGSFLARTYKEALEEANMLENLDQDWKDNVIVFKINTGKLDHGKLEVDNCDNPREYMYNDVVPSGCLVRNG